MWKAFDVTEFYFLWTSLFNMCSPCVSPFQTSPLPWKEKDIHFMYIVESDFVINTCENHAQLTRLFLHPYSYLSFPGATDPTPPLLLLYEKTKAAHSTHVRHSFTHSVHFPPSLPFSLSLPMICNLQTSLLPHLTFP